MRLKSDPQGVIYDTAAQVVTTINSFAQLTEKARDTMYSCLIRLCDNDAARVNDVLRFCKTVYANSARDDDFNPVTALMYGIETPHTVAQTNLYTFVSHLSGDSIVDIRKVEDMEPEPYAIAIGDNLDPTLLEKFTPDRHATAYAMLHGMAHIIAEDMGIEGKFLRNKDSADAVNIPSPTTMVASGIMPRLLSVVTVSMDAEMDALPAELLITLYHDDLAAGLPYAGIYGEYTNKLKHQEVR